MRLLRLLLLVALVLLLLPPGFAAWRVLTERRPQEPVPAEGRLVATALGRIYVEETGPPAGTPVLLVHGVPGWAGIWRDTGAALAAQGYRVLAFDMPPMGWSDRGDALGYGRAAAARRLMALVAALDIRPVLVAQGFGAGAAAEAAMAQPSRFRGLVIVSGALGVGRAGISSLPLPLEQPALRRLAVASTLTNPLLGRWLLARHLYRKAAATEAMAARIALPYSRLGTTPALADWLPSWYETPDLPSARGDAWASLDLPLALIWGAEDDVTPPAQGRYLHDLTGAPLTVLPAVGHMPQIEDPAAFDAALSAALGTMVRPAGAGAPSQ